MQKTEVITLLCLHLPSLNFPFPPPSFANLNPIINTSQADPTYLELFANLNLRHLDIFLRVPDSANAYSPALISIPNSMGAKHASPLSSTNSQKAALEIKDAVSAAQERPLERLTMHTSRAGYGDRSQPYLMFAKLQVRHGENGEYEFRGKQEWSGLGDLEEELWLEED